MAAARLAAPRLKGEEYGGLSQNLASGFLKWIGTGPFKLVKWKPDQHIRMVRFDDYKPRSEKPNGYGGAKIAYVDEIRWIPVPDVATRVAQVETGELDFADDLNPNAYDRLQKSPKAFCRPPGRKKELVGGRPARSNGHLRYYGVPMS